MSGNTANDIEALADAKGFDMQVDGNDTNMLDLLNEEADAGVTFSGNDDNYLELLAAAIPDPDPEA